MKKIALIFYLTIITLTASAQDSVNIDVKKSNPELSEHEKKIDEYNQLKKAFWETAHEICMEALSHKVNNYNKREIALRVCDCYALTMMDKINWQKLSLMTTGQQIASYVSQFDTEVRQECKDKLYQSTKYETVQPSRQHYAKASKISESDKLLETFFGSIVMSIIFGLVGYGISCITKKKR